MPGPSASQAQLAAGVRIARRDQTLQRLVDLSARPASSVWTPGVDLTYPLARPAPIHAVLPYVAIPPDAPAHGDCVRPYARGWAHVDTTTPIRKVNVLVDLERGAVVEISPRLLHGQMSYSSVPGRPHPRCEEAG
jgi:hypothetical protein